MEVTRDRAITGTIGGRYEIEGLLASGGMGEVYRARDTVLGRTVALKVVRGNLASDPAFLSRLRAEATNAARLSHPSIVQVYDFGLDGGVAYMAMELVEGRTLRAVLAERGRLAPQTAAWIAAQVCGALEHARRAGIVHRDVKPENILVAPDGQVKVADFGLSRALAEARETQAGVVLGTAAYIAPEQIEGGAGDHRADLYALGVVLFEMLTGRPPFTGDHPAAVAYRRVSQDVPPPSGLAPGVPRDLDEIVARATARDAERRFPTAAAMAQALRAAAPLGPPEELGQLAGHTAAIPLEARETVAVPRRARRARLRRRRALALVALLALAGAGIPVAARLLSRVDVPDVRGMTQERAKSALERAGLTADVLVENHPTVPASRVIAQDPAAGAQVRRGARVAIKVSLGPELVGLPDVQGVSFGTARGTLESAGFVVDRVDAFAEDVPKGRVVSQDPAPNLRLERGTTVTLTVSKGPELVAVPDVAGEPEASARAELEAAGLAVRVTRAFDDDVAQGLVVSQDPRAGREVRKGSTVTLVVSRGATPVAVPDLRCMTKRQAADALAARGLKASFSGRGQKVVDQAPAPGDQVPRGSTVTVYMGFGSFC